jgi:peptide/nickel transport system permease protein
LALGGGGIVAIVTVVGFCAHLLAPYDPISQDLYSRLQPPSFGHVFGTDDFGRDVFSRIIHGSLISIRIGVVTVLAAAVIGTMLGLWSGYKGGWSDVIIMRFVDIMLAFPSILLAIAIVAITGPGINNVIFAVSVVLIPQFARIVRSSVLAIKALPFVEAEEAMGAGKLRILIFAILPNCMTPLVVQSTLSMGTAILDAAGLSFLGLGAQPPMPEWGAMLAGGRSLIFEAPWIMTFPGLSIFILVLSFNLFGDGLRDALDPKMDA